jgi:eukaryotic-like serine/threonine-protein kinase
MDSARWQRIQTLFHGAADLPPAQQHLFLQENCGDDQTLLADVTNLLREDAEASSLLERDVAQVAHEVLSDGSTSAAEQFGRYRIKKTLGAGGMGIVYLAEREDLGSLVAIKILRDAWLSPARRERFAFEQRTLAQLNHPYIARLYDADTSPDGTPFFAMEYVEGVPLTAYCAQHRCAIDERLKLFREVCEAVVYAHQHAVIHRDLKPSNILVKEDGTVRLLDFGIAKQLEVLGEGVDQTMTGLRLMTPAYASPEQIRGEQVGIQTDVYSLGVVLYELLSGSLPFDLSSKTPVQAEKILTEQEPERLSLVANRAAEQSDQTQEFSLVSRSSWSDLDVLCLTAMHKDPRRRYASAEALLRDVDHYLKGEALEAQPDSARYRMRKFVTRNRRAVTAAAAAVVLTAGLITFFTVRLARARDAALAEAARTQRIQRFMTNLFQGGDEAAGPADNLRVVSLLDRGVQEAQALSGEREVQAQLYLTLGSIYQQLGKFDQANTLLSSALDKRKALFGTDSRDVAECLVALGMLRDSQAQYPEAEKLVGDGLAMYRRHLPATHPAIAKTVWATGRILVDRGAYDQSIPVLEEAAKLQAAAGGTSPDLVATLTELANSQFYVGQYAASEALNRRVLDLDRKIYGPTHPNVADVLINLGNIQAQWGHYDQAEKFERDALVITQDWYGRNHPETASALTNLARTLIFEDKLNEADGMLREALGIQERVYGKVHPRVASALNDLGKIAMRRGNLDDAEACFSRMADIYRSVYDGKHYYIGVATANLGGVYMERKEFVRAEELFRKALDEYASTLPAGHLNIGIGKIRLGRALLRQKRFVEAQTETQAGYEILTKQSAAPGSYLQIARTDLAEEYDALKQPQLAAKFRAEPTKQ